MAKGPTAEFGPEATQLSAPQGAGATPLEGIKTPASGIDLSPVSTFISGLGNMFEGMLKDRAEERKQQVLSEFVKENSKNDQAFAQTKNRTAWMTRKKMIEDQFLTSNPELTEQFTKIVSLRKGGVAEETENEFQAEQKRRDALLSEASKFAPTNVSPESQDLLIETVRTTNLMKEKTAEYRESEKFRASMAASDREAYDYQHKKESSQLVVQLAGSHEASLNSVLFDLAKRVQAGGDPLLAQKEAQDYYNKIQFGLSAAAAGNPEIASPFKANIENIWNTYKDSLKPGADLAALENEKKKIQTRAYVSLFGKDPQFAELAVASQTFANQPDILVKLDAKISKFLVANGHIENGRTSPAIESAAGERIVGVPSLEKPAYEAIKAAVKLSLDGNPYDRAVQTKEAHGQIKAVVDQFVDLHLVNKLTPETRKNMNELLLDKSMAKFLKENPLPVSLANGLTRVVEENFKQYKGTVRNLLRDVLQGAYKNDPGNQVLMPSPSVLGGGVENYDVPDTRRGKDVDPLDAINISWRGDRMVFTPVKMPVDPEQQAMLITRLNKAADVLSNGVIIGAHVHGEENYGKYFDSVKHMMFEGKFPIPDAPKEEKPKAPPAPPGVKRNKAEEAMAQDVAELNTPSAPDGNEGIRIQYNLDSIRKELKKHKKGSPEYNILMEEFARNVEGM